MPDLATTLLPDFVRNAQILWNMGAASVTQSMRGSGLVREMPIPDQTGNTREFTEIDLEEYASRKNESEQSSHARVQQGYSKIGYMYRVSKEINVSFELRKYGKYPEIKQKLMNLGRLAANRLDLDLAHRISFMTATSYVDQDGVTVDTSVGDTLCLASTAHTVRGSATTFRNRLANNPQLSRGSLEAMQKMRVENCINQFGQKMSMDDDILWTTEDPNTVNTARELLRSTANPTQANASVVNVYQGRYRHVIVPRIATTASGAVDTTKAKYWGVASSTYCTLYLGMNEEPHMKAPPTEGGNGEDPSTDDWKFGTRGGWMIVTVSANWFGGSTGDGTA